MPRRERIVGEMRHHRLYPRDSVVRTRSGDDVFYDAVSDDNSDKQRSTYADAAAAGLFKEKQYDRHGYPEDAALAEQRYDSKKHSEKGAVHILVYCRNDRRVPRRYGF